MLAITRRLCQPKLPSLRYIKPGDENENVNRMRKLNQADFYVTNQQKSYMDEWNQHYFNKNVNKPGTRNKKLIVGGTLMGTVIAIYVLALNRFRMLGDDVFDEMDKEAADNRNQRRR